MSTREYYEQFRGDLEERTYHEGKSVQRFWHEVKLSSILKGTGEDELLLDLDSTKYLWDVFGRGRDYRKQHLSKFSVNSLKKTLKGTGFEIKSIKTIFRFTPYISIVSKKLAILILPLENILLNLINVGMLMVCASTKNEY